MFPRAAQLPVMSQPQRQTGRCCDRCEQTIAPSVALPLANAPGEKHHWLRGPFPRQRNKRAISQLYRRTTPRAGFQTWRLRDHQTAGVLVPKYKGSFQLHMQVSQVLNSPEEKTPLLTSVCCRGANGKQCERDTGPPCSGGMMVARQRCRHHSSAMGGEA